MAYLGCPVVGDLMYGQKKVTLPLKRQFLHAARLGFQLPGEQAFRTFEAPLPNDLQTILDNLE